MTASRMLVGETAIFQPRDKFMEVAPLPDNENERIESLLSYDILDTGFEKAYQELVELAAYICETPIALISLIDSERQWFKAKVGLDANQTSRDLAFCAHAILQDGLFIVPDALSDRRFADNPLVTHSPSIRFYAGAPLVTKDGFALGTLCAIDSKPRTLTSEQQKALKALAKQVMSQLELRLAFKQLQKYAKELQELNANKDKFFSIISHDLRAPFNGLIGYTEILKTEFDNLDRHETKDLLTELHDSASTTYNLLENLLQWSMLETGQMICRSTLLQVDLILKRVSSLLCGAAAQKAICLSVVPNPDAWVQADPNMLNSILQNLISNAIKFSYPSSSIQVSSAIKDEMVEISVADTGIGMKQQQIAKLFSVETAKTTIGTAGETGTGLGLLLCKQFVNKHGGDLWVESEVGKGSRFTFSLPKAHSTNQSPVS